jgi:hypothetical protein
VKRAPRLCDNGCGRRAAIELGRHHGKLVNVCPDCAELPEFSARLARARARFEFGKREGESCQQS